MKDNFGNTLNKTITTGIITGTATVGLIACTFANFETPALLIIGLNTVAIMSVWIFGRPRKSESPTIKTLNQFETRIQELIDAFEDRLAKKHIESLDTPTLNKPTDTEQQSSRHAPSSSMPSA